MTLLEDDLRRAILRRWDARRTHGSASGRIDEVLFIQDSGDDLSEVVECLRQQGMSPLVALNQLQAENLVARWRPPVAIVATRNSHSESLLRYLERRNVPVLLIAPAAQLARAEHVKTLVAAILMPPDPMEVARATKIALGEDDLKVLPESIELGPLRLDVRSQRAFVDGKKVELPPKQFAILIELAVRPGESVSSAELVRRVWPAAGATSAEDVHTHVYRLRKLINDQSRSRPLIVSRRGFGYSLAVETA